MICSEVQWNAERSQVKCRQAFGQTIMLYPFLFTSCLATFVNSKATRLAVSSKATKLVKATSLWAGHKPANAARAYRSSRVNLIKLTTWTIEKGCGLQAFYSFETIVLLSAGGSSSSINALYCLCNMQPITLVYYTVILVEVWVVTEWDTVVETRLCLCGLFV